MVEFATLQGIAKMIPPAFNIRRESNFDRLAGMTSSGKSYPTDRGLPEVGRWLRLSTHT
jgi:hypothetical protein